MNEQAQPPGKSICIAVAINIAYTALFWFLTVTGLMPYDAYEGVLFMLSIGTIILVLISWGYIVYKARQLEAGKRVLPAIGAILLTALTALSSFALFLLYLVGMTAP